MPQSGLGVHHYHARKRIHFNLEQWPHPNRLKRIVDRMVYVIATFAVAVTIPQAVEIWVRKNAEGVSPVSWAGYSIVSFFWLLYGLLHREPPLIIINGIWVFLNAFIALGALMYA